jgi:phytoene synthase
MARRDAGVKRAYDACEALARSHYENFPVASRLLPAPMRPHVAAVYAFARVADDLADEGVASQAGRLAALHDWQARLHAAVEYGREAQRDSSAGDLIVTATAHSIRELELPISLFDDLVSAFAQDTMTTRYDSWHDVFDYCRRSANPVGRLVLRIAGYRENGAAETSADALCTALQLTNFWQDFGRDYRAGRIYVPREVQSACGAHEDDLAADRMTPAWRRALDACAEITASQFERGRTVCDAVAGRLRLELRFTWLGGCAILSRVRGEADLLHHRPTLGASDVPALIFGAVRWRRAEPAAA